MIYSDGHMYIGNFEKNQPTNEGTYYDSFGKIVPNDDF